MTGSRRWWWVSGVLVVVVLLTAAVLWQVTKAGAAHEDNLSAAVRASLTAEARDAIESGASADLPADEGRLACAVRVLGTDPPAVTDAAQARTVYVWTMCATVDSDVSTESSLPVAVHLTSPPTVEAPGDGALNTPDKHRIFPKRLWDLTQGDRGDYGLESQMRQRARERA